MYRKECRDSQWTADDTEKLRRIVSKQPYLFLDEIRDPLGLQTGRWWNGSWIWVKIRVISSYRCKLFQSSPVKATKCPGSSTSRVFETFFSMPHRQYFWMRLTREEMLHVAAVVMLPPF